MFVFNVTYFRESLTDWVIGINLEDAVQVILLQHRDAGVLSLGGAGAGGGRRRGVRGGGLVSQLPRAGDARTGEAHARSTRSRELKIYCIILVLLRQIYANDLKKTCQETD